MKHGLLITAAVALVFATAGSSWWFATTTGQSNTAVGAKSSASADLSYTQGNHTGGLNGLRGTRSEVSVNAWLSGPITSDGTRALSVRLEAAKGWHVNANPPSLDFLIPTVVKAEIGGKPVPIKIASYPPGQPSNIVLGHTNIRVYTTNTTLEAELLPATLKKARVAGGLTVVVQAQACSDRGICLPPSDIRAPVPWT